MCVCVFVCVSVMCVCAVCLLRLSISHDGVFDSAFVCEGVCMLFIMCVRMCKCLNRSFMSWLDRFFYLLQVFVNKDKSNKLDHLTLRNIVGFVK